MRGRLRPGDGTITNHLVVETQAALGGIVAGKVPIDEKRHRLAEQSRRLAFGHQKNVAVKRGTMRSHPVALQILRRDQSVGLQVVAQHAQIDAFECTIGLRGVDQEGMTLLARPARQVAGAKVARKSLLTGDLGECIGAVAQPAVGVERTRHRVRRRIKLQRCGIGSNQVEAKGNARSNPTVEQFSARDRGPHAALPL